MRLVLHAGTHKTGTTSIQSALAENRDWLREHGYVFPSLGSVGHNEFAYRLAKARPENIEGFRAAIMDVTDPERVLVLSAEEFSTHLVGAKQWRFDKTEYWDRRRDYLERLKSVLRDFDAITLFLCFRRHDAFAQSLYTTNILSDQYRWSFAEFRERCAPLFDYRRQVETFREVFADVRYVDFDSLRHALVPEFCRWTGIPVPPKALREPKKVSPDARLIYWVYRRGSEAADDADVFKLRASFVGSNAATSILPDKPSSLWRSEHEWRDFIACCTDPEPNFFPARRSSPPIAETTEEEIASIDKTFASWRLRPRKEKRWARSANVRFSLRDAW
jgi:hypothetical protein